MNTPRYPEPPHHRRSAVFYSRRSASGLSRLLMLGLFCAGIHLDVPDVASADAVSGADAETEQEEETSWGQRHAFERDFAVGLYGIGQTGSYHGGGFGARLRTEYFRPVGLEVYTDHTFISDPDGFRHDHPIGFNLYVPFRISEAFRIRPLFGFCTVFSYTQLNQPQPGAEDVLKDIHFGVHLGFGLEVALPVAGGRFASLFLDIKGTGYFGNSRIYGGWSANLSSEIDFWLLATASAGVQFHL